MPCMNLIAGDPLLAAFSVPFADPGNQSLARAQICHETLRNNNKWAKTEPVEKCLYVSNTKHRCLGKILRNSGSVVHHLNWQRRTVLRFVGYLCTGLTGWFIPYAKTSSQLITMNEKSWILLASYFSSYMFSLSGFWSLDRTSKKLTALAVIIFECFLFSEKKKKQ